MRICQRCGQESIDIINGEYKCNNCGFSQRIDTSGYFEFTIQIYGSMQDAIRRYDLIKELCDGEDVGFSVLWNVNRMVVKNG